MKQPFLPTEAIEGAAPFKCYVCAKSLISDIEGEYTVKLKCPRCKTRIILVTEHALPDTLVVKHGALVKL